MRYSNTILTNIQTTLLAEHQGLEPLTTVSKALRSGAARGTWERIAALALAVLVSSTIVACGDMDADPRSDSVGERSAQQQIDHTLTTKTVNVLNQCTSTNVRVLLGIRTQYDHTKPEIPADKFEIIANEQVPSQGVPAQVQTAIIKDRKALNYPPQIADVLSNNVYAEWNKDIYNADGANWSAPDNPADFDKIRCSGLDSCGPYDPGYPVQTSQATPEVMSDAKWFKALIGYVETPDRYAGFTVREEWDDSAKKVIATTTSPMSLYQIEIPATVSSLTLVTEKFYFAHTLKATLAVDVVCVQ